MRLTSDPSLPAVPRSPHHSITPSLDSLASWWRAGRAPIWQTSRRTVAVPMSRQVLPAGIHATQTSYLGTYSANYGTLVPIGLGGSHGEDVKACYDPKRPCRLWVFRSCTGNLAILLPRARPRHDATSMQPSSTCRFHWSAHRGLSPRDAPAK